MPELAIVVAVFLTFLTLAVIGIVALAIGKISRDYENRD